MTTGYAFPMSKKRSKAPKAKKQDPEGIWRDLVRSAMKRQDQTNTSVAEGVGIKRETLARWLLGQRRIYSPDIAEVFAFLGIKVSAYSGD